MPKRSRRPVRWCHGDFGMKTDKGPRLAGTQMSEKQVEERIRNGKAAICPRFANS